MLPSLTFFWRTRLESTNRVAASECVDSEACSTLHAGHDQGHATAAARGVGNYAVQLLVQEEGCSEICLKTNHSVDNT